MFCCSRRGARLQQEAERRQDAALPACSSASSVASSIVVPPLRQSSAAVQPLVTAQGAGSGSHVHPQQAQASAEQPLAVISPGLGAVSAPEDERICRVCWGGESEEEPLIRPCGCKGSLTYAHRDCIRQWTDRSKRIKCEICRQPLVTRRQAIALVSRATFASIVNAWFFANFIMLAANLPGLLGLFVYQLTMPLRVPLDKAFEQPCHSFNSCVRLQMPLVVTGDTLLYIIAALHSVGAFRGGTRLSIRACRTFTTELVNLMANRSVATIVKEALGHSQRNGWLVAFASIALLCLPWALSYPVQMLFGPHAAAVCYMYGAFWELLAAAAVLPCLNPVRRHLFAPAHAAPA